MCTGKTWVIHSGLEFKRSKKDGKFAVWDVVNLCAIVPATLVTIHVLANHTASTNRKSFVQRTVYYEPVLKVVADSEDNDLYRTMFSAT